MLLFSGYLIPYAQIPGYFKWLYDISFFQYALGLVQINQFAGMDFTDCPPKLEAANKDRRINISSPLNTSSMTGVSCGRPPSLHQPRRLSGHA